MRAASTPRRTSPPSGCARERCRAVSSASQPARRPAPHMPSFRLSAVRVGVQPAAELRHLQRHEHAIHVRGALLPVPCSRNCSRALFPARC
eukprot:scaffold69773_cov45-Phaeocystis_antarctica.AAC.1